MDYSLSSSQPQPESDSSAKDDHSPPKTAKLYVKHMALQGAAVFIVLSLAWPYFLIRKEPLPPMETVAVIGIVALILACITRQPWWWRLIHALFTPLAWVVSTLTLNPGWFFLAFVVTVLVYRGAITGQVPLYLSNSKTAKILAELIKDRADQKKFIDLGAGIGSIIAPLSKHLPTLQLTGIENAPATWLIGYLRTLGTKNCRWRWGDIWEERLSAYTVVYAFLSPAPMAALWKKVKQEMPPGSLFISNSFPVPGVEATRIIEVDDARGTLLFCYQL